MRILIFGGNGWIGQQFVEIVSGQHIEHRVAASRVDLDHIRELEDEMDAVAPTHVVSFLGRTHGEKFTTIDYLEQPGKLVENVRDNLMAPIILAQLCADRDIHYTYLGTGCIFNNDDNDCMQAFKETDKPNFFGSSYSIVKGITDRFMAWRQGQGPSQEIGRAHV
jgi:dTDP-4-dehydrorhamnose reductase